MNLPGSCKAVCWKSHVLSCSCLLGQGRSVLPSWWRYIRACPAWKERNLSMTVAGARMAGEDGNCNAAFPRPFNIFLSNIQSRVSDAQTPLKCRNAFQALHNLTCCLGFQVDSQPGNTPTSASCRRRRFQVPAPLSIHLVIRYSLLSRFDRPWAIGQQIVPGQVRIISCLPVSATRHHLERASELQGDRARVPPPQGAVA